MRTLYGLLPTRALTGLLLLLTLLMTLLAAGCGPEGAEVVAPETPIPSSLAAPTEVVVATVAGRPITIRELDMRDHPTAVNQRGDVLTAFSLLPARGEEIRLAPGFWPQGLNGRTVVGYPGVVPQDCPLPFALDVGSGERTALAFPDGWDAGVPRDVNEAGRVVGWLGRRNAASTCEVAFQQAVIWWKGAAELLPALEPGDYTVAEAISPRGAVAGVSGTRAVVWEEGQVRPVGPEGVYISYARDVNASGTVVGFAQPELGGRHVAFAWEDGVTTLLPSVGAASFARAVNDRGMIVGTSVGPDENEHAVLWYRGELIDLGTLGGDRSEARAVNEAGEIVGWAEDGEGVLRPVVWRVGG